MQKKAVSFVVSFSIIRSLLSRSSWSSEAHWKERERRSNVPEEAVTLSHDAVSFVAAVARAAEGVASAHQAVLLGRNLEAVPRKAAEGGNHKERETDIKNHRRGASAPAAGHLGRRRELSRQSFETREPTKASQPRTATMFLSIPLRRGAGWAQFVSSLRCKQTPARLVMRTLARLL